MVEYYGLQTNELDRAKSEMEKVLNSQALAKRVSFFKMFGDTNRMKIIELLLQYPQLCVNEISTLIGATIATTSHHLIALKKQGIIESVKEGKFVIYKLDTSLVNDLFDVYNKYLEKK
ncbi:helix-turn-helix transcriptional regulator [Aerococcaceae bacterium zg-ZUI334]|uniref:ArsR/SmtB family transcription factor n=1 Tax=Aerococcaceae TaxID=186827 RepID=UPI0013BD8B0F|nr:MULTISPECIES: metalloregulator ArsR/SmtB family transcription factor [unclassified Facklamia]MBR7926669.1 helix-turn-helix transcriptional regulator [Aerococcaceae bacterium zg-ZUI334]MBS4461622.1 helix-turn-helix transcriptional regulator [Aerococcaceae bacterium zg-B36]QQD65261.1 helix-turn-helix transcriptional regulator [Aerococcaceae bacterium zg-252]NEW63914.1 metalloregulator ArsR/SmtB family transcription factor [Facklamia sp. 252]NEW67385.1 metalloregulator ArsR/SmtB family transcr